MFLCILNTIFFFNLKYSPWDCKEADMTERLSTAHSWLTMWLVFCFLSGFFFFFLLYNTVLVLPYINMNLPRVYTCSQSWIPRPPPSPHHLSGSSQCTSPKHPVPCIEPRLAVRFLHVSVPFSQIIPPSPSPTETKSLFYTSVSLLLSRIQG